MKKQRLVLDINKYLIQNTDKVYGNTKLYPICIGLHNTEVDELWTMFWKRSNACDKQLMTDYFDYYVSFEEGNLLRLFTLIEFCNHYGIKIKYNRKTAIL